MTIENSDRLIKIDEVAKLLSLSSRKVNAMLATGELDRVKLGRATRIRLSDVHAIISGEERVAKC